ncbi:MAG: ribosome maturation factor RimP [Clostridiales bacterium]|nr:ribosome maturation factor RimP [Clostridiales bacterium]
MAKEDVSAKVSAILEEHLADRDLEIYRITYKKEGPAWILRVFLDKPAGSEQEYVSIEECEEVTRYLSDKLDELDLIERSYNLEVSSPGLDRELIRESDYERFAGRAVEVRTYEPISGSKYIEGTLVGKDGDTVTIEVNGDKLDIPAKKISKINLAVVF